MYIQKYDLQTVKKVSSTLKLISESGLSRSPKIKIKKAGELFVQVKN